MIQPFLLDRKVNLTQTHISWAQTMYSVLHICRWHAIVDCISQSILLLNCLYLIKWYYRYSREGTDLSCSEHSTRVEINMTYRLKKRQKDKNLNTKKYQARWSTNESVLSGEFRIINTPHHSDNNVESEISGQRLMWAVRRQDIRHWALECYFRSNQYTWHRYWSLSLIIDWWKDEIDR